MATGPLTEDDVAFLEKIQTGAWVMTERGLVRYRRIMRKLRAQLSAQDSPATPSGKPARPTRKRPHSTSTG